MSVVISVRIPRELKEKMDKLKHINWSEEIREFIRRKIEEYEIREALKRVEEHLQGVPELPPGTIAKWVRSDRESH